MYLVFSLDGVIVEETKAATKQLEAAWSNKWYRAYSAMCGYVLTCLSLNLERAFRLLVQGPSSDRPHPVRLISEYRVEAYILVIRG